jgi:hypothetical protein
MAALMDSFTFLISLGMKLAKKLFAISRRVKKLKLLFLVLMLKENVFL